MPILGFARRMTAYKRPDLLFTDLERLKAIARKRPFQVVMAGKAHPRDDGGKQLIQRLHAHTRNWRASMRVVFLPDYDMDTGPAHGGRRRRLAQHAAAPLEASGTSGMKAAFNGVPELSRARRLVGRGLHRRGDRLGDRR